MDHARLEEGATRIAELAKLHSTTSEQPPAALYHYTTADAFLSIVSSDEIWATDNRFFNDASEVEYASNIVLLAINVIDTDDLTPTEIELLRELSHSFDVRHSWINIYVVSLSELPDDLSQWRAYSGSIGGVAVGFDMSFFLERKKDVSVLRLVRVTYDEAEHWRFVVGLIRDILEVYQSVVQFDTTLEQHEIARKRCCDAFRIALSGFLLQAKSKHWSSEREWRLCYLIPTELRHRQLRYRVGKLGLTPYVPVPLTMEGARDSDHLPLSKVIVGPCEHPNLQREAYVDCLNSNQFDTQVVSVVNSQVPLRF